ncbi:methyltransferase domain-containing protein [Pseudarthrobacter sp. N5]|uniref:methyltransferase domain-containing protein n=1 Tax=Pseudarthrobacter sp. N5 TaxID=3418416 RepID=UPI003CE9D6BC
MLPDAANLLLCPSCRGRFLSSDGGPGNPGAALRCPVGHSFDAAKQGYFNLLVGRGTVFEADSASMVAARFEFLEGGHYRPLAEAVAASVAPALAGDKPVVLDAGTGTGHYLRCTLDTILARHSAVAAIALDISKFALRRAARMNPEAANLVCDVWQPLPVADAAVDAVTVVFAPRNPAEFARVLRPAGLLVVVTPRPGHLAEIAARTGMLGIEPDKDERLAESMGGHFHLNLARDLDLQLSLSPTDVENLAYMGPAGHHLNRASLTGRLAGLAAVTDVWARFRINVFERLQDPGSVTTWPRSVPTH